MSRAESGNGSYDRPRSEEQGHEQVQAAFMKWLEALETLMEGCVRQGMGWTEKQPLFDMLDWLRRILDQHMRTEMPALRRKDQPDPRSILFRLHSRKIAAKIEELKRRTASISDRSPRPSSRRPPESPNRRVTPPLILAPNRLRIHAASPLLSSKNTEKGGMY